MANCAALEGGSLDDRTMDNAFLFCLSNNANQPCLVIKWPDASIMLDCALDIPFLCGQVNPIGVTGRMKCGKIEELVSNDDIVPNNDLFTIEETNVILLSHSTSFLTLPFITERTHFAGLIFASEPTLTFGQHLMQEIAHYVHRAPVKIEDENELEQITKRIRSFWDTFYTVEEVNNCLSKVHVIGLNERKIVNGFGHVTNTCSGYSIGSSNWLIERGLEKIAYLSASSSLSTHSKTFTLGELAQANSLIVSSLSRFPAKDPDMMLALFSSSIMETLSKKGNVLIPCIPQGLTYDLLECLFIQLDRSHTSNVSVYIVSEVARNCLAYANIYSEWLSDAKMSRAFVAEEPFLHGILVRNNRLKPFRSVYGKLNREFRSPCVVFASHPSLLFGDAVHFMQIWKKSRQNAVILTDPDYASGEVLQPFLPMAMKAVVCPIDTRLTAGQVCQAVMTIQPNSIYVHANDQAGFSGPTGSAEWKCSQVMTCYSKESVLSIPCENKWVELAIEPSAIAKNTLRDIGRGMAVTPVSGMLSQQQCRYVLQENKSAVLNTETRQLICPQPNLIVKKLEQMGFTQYAQSNSNPTYEKEGVSVSLEPNCTHVVLKRYDEQQRQQIRRCLLDAMVEL